MDSSTRADFSFLNKISSRSFSCAKNGRSLVSVFVTAFRYSSRGGFGSSARASLMSFGSLGLRPVSIAMYFGR